jgi:DNA polymerase Ligase (LigD)
MPRFVILDHNHPFPHFDLMLESHGKLRTWRLLGKPTSAVAISAEALGDHRIDYLDYEGPLSGDRGRVVRWDGGIYDIQRETLSELVLQLAGTRCRGTGTLQISRGSWSWRWHQSPGA